MPKEKLLSNSLGFTSTVCTFLQTTSPYLFTGRKGKLIVEVEM